MVVWKNEAHLAAKGYTKTGLAYIETFSLVVKLATVHLLPSLVAIKGWKLA